MNHRGTETQRKDFFPGDTRKEKAAPGQECHYPAHNVITRLVRVIHSGRSDRMDHRINWVDDTEE